MVGLHSSDPATVYLAAWARVASFTREMLEHALYTERSLLRMLGMRRTMFVVTRDLAAVMDAACTRHMVESQRHRLLRMLDEHGVSSDAETWLADVERRTLDAIERLGEATAVQLRNEVPELQEQLVYGEGKRWGGRFGVSTRVLFLLATSGQILRGRPLGTWLSSQYRWAATTQWLGADLEWLPADPARAELVRRWLRTFGPGTEQDVKWWTGWTFRDTRTALAAAGAAEVELDDGIGYVMPADLEPVDPPHPWIALLPALDPTVMGWKDRAWYLGDHRERLFDTNGNAGPTVWAHGRIVGGWSQHTSGEVVVRLLEDVGKEAAAGIETAAATLTAWLDGTRITPRFRTPLEKELRG